MPTIEGGPRCFDTRKLRPAAAGLATLVPKLVDQFAKLGAIAHSPASVVIYESGTGKEVSVVIVGA